MSPAALADVVAIERPAEHAQAAQAAIDSCNLVLGSGRCHAAVDAPEQKTWYAVVRWDVTYPERAEIQIHRQHREGPLLVVRHVEFAPNDGLEQRYRALGLLIVSHVVAHASQVEPPAPPISPPRPVVPEPPVLRLGVDAAGLTGPGVEAGNPRVGGFLRPWLASNEQPWRVWLRVGYSGDVGPLDAEWFDAALGAGLRLNDPGDAHGIELGLAAVAQRVSLHASDIDGRSESHRFMRWGARVGVEGELTISDALGLLLGVDGELLYPGYTLDVAGERVGEQLAPNWSAILGLRISL